MRFRYFSRKYFRLYISCAGSMCITTRSLDRDNPPRVFEVVGVLEDGAWVALEVK